MKGPPLGSGGEDITWSDKVAPRGGKASSTRKIKPQTSNRSSACHWNNVPPPPTLLASVTRIISPCALGTPKHLAMATFSLSSSNACCSCGPKRQVVLFVIKSVRMALV